MSSNTNGLLVRNAFHLGVGQVASTAIGIASAAVVGRSLEPSDFGILYVVFAISAFVGIIADWGQGTCVVREVARGRADEPELIGGAVLIRLASSAGATALAGAVALGLGYDERVVMLTLVAMIVGFPSIISIPYSLTFRAKDRMEIDAAGGVVSKAAALVATIVALHFGGGLIELILMQGVGTLASLMFVMFFAVRNDIRAKYPTPGTMSVVFWGGMPVMAFSLVIGAQPFLETLLLSALTTPVVVGWYGASRIIFGIIISPAMILMGASFPELSRAALSPPRLRQTLKATLRVVFIVAAFVASFLYLFADHLVATIYGHGRFKEAAEILRAGAVFVPLLFLVMLLVSALWAVGRNKALVVINIARILFCVIASWFLIGIFQERMGNGAVGLVYIAGVAEVPAVIALLAVLPREVAGYALLFSLARTYVAAICVVVVVSQLQPLTLWYLIPVFFLTFAIVAMISRLVVWNDIRVAFDIVRSKGLSR